MSNWSSIVAFLGRLLLASYFLKAGINNALNRDKLVGLIKSKKIPFPYLVLVLVVITEVLGSLAIIFNFYAIPAAIALIIFTVAVNFLICNFWSMEGLQKRNISFLFYANIAVVGALLLVTSMAPRG